MRSREARRHALKLLHQRRGSDYQISLVFSLLSFFFSTLLPHFRFAGVTGLCRLGEAARERSAQARIGFFLLGCCRAKLEVVNISRHFRDTLSAQSLAG